MHCYVVAMVFLQVVSQFHKDYIASDIREPAMREKEMDFESECKEK